MEIVTLGQLRREPSRLVSLGSLDVLVAAAAAGELVLERRPAAAATAPSGEQGGTAMFRHETIALMQAERAADILQLRRALADSSAVLPVVRRPESFWENVTLGRGATADIVLEDRAVSTLHAELVLDPAACQIFIVDLGSSNGSFVNRQQMQPHCPQALRSGDCLRLGQTVLYFVSNSMLANLSQ